MTAQTMATPREFRWLRGILATVILIGVILGATYYFRPVMLGIAIEQITMWKQGIHRGEMGLGPYRIHFLLRRSGNRAAGMRHFSTCSPDPGRIEITMHGFESGFRMSQQ